MINLRSDEKKIRRMRHLLNYDYKLYMKTARVQLNQGQFLRGIIKSVTDLDPTNTKFIKTLIDFLMEEDNKKKTMWFDVDHMSFIDMAEKLYQHFEEFRLQFLKVQSKTSLNQEKTGIIDKKQQRNRIDEDDEDVAVFRKFMKHILDIAAQQNQIGRLNYGKLFEHMIQSEDLDFFIKLSKIEVEFELSATFSQKAIELFPDSEKLWLLISAGDHRLKSQDIIDRALITFADNGIEINPRKWLEEAIKMIEKQGRKPSCHDYRDVNSLLVSLLPMIDNHTMNKYLKDDQNFRFLHSVYVLRAFSKNKLCWVQVLFTNFHINQYQPRLYVYFFEILHYNSLNDCAILHIILARQNWAQGKLTAAERYFDFVNSNAEWEKLLTEQCVQFQAEFKEFKQEKLKKVLRYVNLEEVLLDYSVNFKELLLQAWTPDEHHCIHEALDKLLFIYPSRVTLWVMKGNIEVYNGKLDQAADTFKRALSAMMMFNGCYIKKVFLYLAEVEKLRGNFFEMKKNLKIYYEHYDQDQWIDSIKTELQFKDKTKALELLAEGLSIFPRHSSFLTLVISMEDRSKRGEKIVEVMEVCNDRTSLILAAAKFFVSRGNMKKSRKWFRKAIENQTVVPIEAWACYYKFEKIWGPKKSANEVLFRFLTNTKLLYRTFWPWNEFIDRVDNWTLTVEEIPEAFAQKIDFGYLVR